MKRLVTSLVILLFVGAGVCFGAALGLYHIAGISDWLYHLPTPQRTVQITNTNLILHDPIIKPAASSTDEIHITLTDEQLTVIARQALAGTDGYFEPGVQLTSGKGTLELFGLLRKPVAANVLIRIAPQVTNGQLTGSVTYAQMGSVPVAPSSVNSVVGPAIAQVQTVLLQRAPGYEVSQATAGEQVFNLVLTRVKK